ncbi:YgjV family protein [Microbacterium phyllosphaerae]|uniref:YgjV family protein n=1 Tax=Microbacterium phyllosphaerae TaxID=124798 RepID=UPI003D64B816
MLNIDLVFEILGWAGSLLLVISILQTRIVWLRVLNLAACVVLLVYNFWLPSWPMIAMNAALVAINVVNLVRLRSATVPNVQGSVQKSHDSPAGRRSGTAESGGTIRR